MVHLRGAVDRDQVRRVRFETWRHRRTQAAGHLERLALVQLHAVWDEAGKDELVADQHLRFDLRDEALEVGDLERENKC